MVDTNNTVFGLAVGYYISVILPKCTPHLDSEGRVLDTSGRPLNPAEPNPHIVNDGFLVVYDGKKLLEETCDMLTSKKGKLSEPTTVGTLEALVEVMGRKGDNSSDLTWFYNHQTGEIASTHTSLKNWYPEEDEKELIQRGFPDNFLSIDGSVPKDKTGKRTSAALLTTKRYDVGAVVMKTSEYGIGGKVVHLKGGRLVEEVFARYDKERNLIELVHRGYRPGREGVDQYFEVITKFPSLYRGNISKEAVQRVA